MAELDQLLLRFATKSDNELVEIIKATRPPKPEHIAAVRVLNERRSKQSHDTELRKFIGDNASYAKMQRKIMMAWVVASVVGLLALVASVLWAVFH